MEKICGFFSSFLFLEIIVVENEIIWYRFKLSLKYSLITETLTHLRNRKSCQKMENFSLFLFSFFSNLIDLINCLKSTDMDNNGHFLQLLMEWKKESREAKQEK